MIDFLVPMVRAGLEVKIKGTAANIVRQLRGYAADERIGHLILITAKSFQVPEALGTRRVPVTVVNISRGWL